jgi:hypothetical protein
VRFARHRSTHGHDFKDLVVWGGGRSSTERRRSLCLGDGTMRELDRVADRNAGTGWAS